MYHSLIINVGDDYIDTWDDWKLIPSSRPVIAPPIERTKFVTVPGRDGSLDYSQTVPKRATFDDRTGKIEFYLENDYEGWDWETAYTTICETLKGQRVRFALEDNRSHYYSGLLWVNQFKSDKGHSKITLEYRVHPTMYTLNVEAVALNVYDLKLNKGMEYQLLVGVGPSNTFYRRVSVTVTPKNVVEITQNGTIRALKKGTAVVTAECGGVKAECTVTVGEFESCTIERNLTGVTETNPVNRIVKGMSYQNVFTVADTEHFTLNLTAMALTTMTTLEPDGSTSVAELWVPVDGSNVTVSDDKTSAEIKMGEVTGNIKITASAILKTETTTPSADAVLPVDVGPLKRIEGAVWGLWK